MRVLSFRRTFRRLFSFASMGISRVAGRGIRRRNRAFKQRRDAFSCWRLDNEMLEPKKLLAVTPGVPTESGTGRLADGLISAAEQAATTTIRVGLTTGAGNHEATDVIQLRLDNAIIDTATLTATEVAAGFVDFSVTGNDWGAADGAHDFTATENDVVGGTGVSTASGQRNLSLIHI